MTPRFLFALPLLLGANSLLAQDSEPSREDIQEVFDRGCGDDNGADRCDSGVQQRMREQYAIADPETLIRQATTVRRAMFVDGYGNDVVAVSFYRAPGQPPTVEIATPHRDGQAQPAALRAAIGGETWARVLSASEHFDKLLATELPRQNESGEQVRPQNFCLHGWFAVVEAVDAPRRDPNTIVVEVTEAEAGMNSTAGESPMLPGRIRADSESACAGGLAVPYAFSLADIARDHLAECSSLDPDRVRNTPELLALCHRLGGDRLAAGEAMELVFKLQRMGGFENVGEELQWLFAGFGDDRAKRFLADIKGASPFFGVPVAADADNAVVVGQLAYRSQEEDRIGEVADITLTLIRETGKFVIQTYEISEKRSCAVN